MDIINKKLEELQALVCEYPLKIPVREVAKFLGMDEEGLKAALMRGNVTWGFGYQKTDGAYRVMVIPTVTFCLWYTNCNGQMIMRAHEPVEQ